MDWKPDTADLVKTSLLEMQNKLSELVWTSTLTTDIYIIKTSFTVFVYI